MKLPRDVSGLELVKALRSSITKWIGQRGSHMRVTTQRDGEHHEVVPNHNPIKVGTLSGILKNVAAHHGINVEDLVGLLGL